MCQPFGMAFLNIWRSSSIVPTADNVEGMKKQKFFLISKKKNGVECPIMLLYNFYKDPNIIQ